MIQRGQRLFLLLGRALQRQPHVSMAKIRRKMRFSDRSTPDAGVGQLVSDQLFEFFADTFGDAFVAVGVQVPGYRAPRVKLQ